MKDFQASKKTIEDVFQGRTYNLPYYQREYAWDTSQIQDLVDDFTSEFLLQYRDGDNTTAVRDYDYYYLGSIIVDANNNLVDGQQRMTSISLLLIYLYHQLKEPDPDLAYELKRLVFSKRTYDAEKRFSISTANREQVMTELLERGHSEIKDNTSESAQKLIERYEDIERLLPRAIAKKSMSVFATWLKANVQVVSIKAENGNDAYRIFSTQNDRGKLLSHLDMLKADIISNIDEDKQNEKNEQWKNIVEGLNTLEPLHSGKKAERNEPELIMTLLLQSHYAQEVVTQAQMKGRGANKRQGTESDFSKVSINFYKWVLSNKALMGLETSDDYCRFIDEYERYANSYRILRIAMSKNEPIHGLENVYHLPAQSISNLFIAAILAPVNLDDTRGQAYSKFNIVARLIDQFVSSYYFRKWSANNETNYAEYFQTLIKKIRYADYDTVRRECLKLARERSYFIDDFTQFLPALNYPKRKNHEYRELKWILARITAYMETVADKHDLTHEYLTETFHIEHILSTHNDNWQRLGFDSPDEYDEMRNNIGALLLLGGKVNSGLNDRAYIDKVNTYCSPIGNVYAATLAYDTTYMHSSVKQLAHANDIPFKSYDEFTKSSIYERYQVINALCKLIWNLDDFNDDCAVVPIDAAAIATDKVSMDEKSSAKKTKRTGRTMFSFDLVGLTVGDTICFCEDPSITAVVCDNKHVLYENTVYALSPLAQKLKHATSPLRGPSFFTYDGERLADMRKRLEKEQSTSAQHTHDASGPALTYMNSILGSDQTDNEAFPDNPASIPANDEDNDFLAETCKALVDDVEKQEEEQAEEQKNPATDIDDDANENDNVFDNDEDTDERNSFIRSVQYDEPSYDILCDAIEDDGRFKCAANGAYTNILVDNNIIASMDVHGSLIDIWFYDKLRFFPEELRSNLKDYSPPNAPAHKTMGITLLRLRADDDNAQDTALLYIETVAARYVL